MPSGTRTNELLTATALLKRAVQQTSEKYFYVGSTRIVMYTQGTAEILRHFSTALIKLAYFATTSVPFFSKLCLNYAALQKLC